MKKKFLWVLLSALLAMATLTGCQNGVEEGSEQTEKKPTGYVISEEGYESIGYANDKYLVVKQDGKYGVIDLDGNVVMDFEWDSWGRYADGYFALGKKTGEDSMHGVLFNEKCEEVFNNDQYPNTYIDSYNEGVLQLTNYLENGMGGYDSTYLDGYNNFSLLFVVNDDLVERHTNSSACNNGMVIIQNWTHNSDKEFYAYIDVNDIKASNGPAGWVPYPCAISDEGYMNGTKIDFETNEKVMTVYNYETDTFYTLPSEVYSTNYVYSDEGYYVSVSKGGYLKVRNEADGPMAVYSVNDADYVTDYAYGYIDLESVGKENYYLVANEDESKWSYLNTDFEEIGTWYDDASGMHGGYAIVSEGGMLYIIDENFEKVFEEGIDGESSSSLEGVSGAFTIKKGDLYYLVQLTYE